MFFGYEALLGTSGEVACLSLGGQIHRLPPPPPHAHTHKHTCCLSVRISYLVTGADAGERVGSTWIIDVSTTGKGAREARENFCGERSNFSTDWKLRQSTPINSALCSSSTITTKTGSN